MTASILRNVHRDARRARWDLSTAAGSSARNSSRSRVMMLMGVEMMKPLKNQSHCLEQENRSKME